MLAEKGRGFVDLLPRLPAQGFWLTALTIVAMEDPRGELGMWSQFGFQHLSTPLDWSLQLVCLTISSICSWPATVCCGLVAERVHDPENISLGQLIAVESESLHVSLREMG